MPPDLTEEERAALDQLIGDSRTDDLHEDLVRACRETMRRREENSRLGSVVIGALYRDVKSWRIVEYATGIPASTARSWAKPPPVEPNDE